MCFSAAASFVAGATLSAIGVATIRKAERPSEIPFASIPLLFGIQQLVEGVIWLTFRNEAAALKQGMTYVYSFFSHVLWPIYIPFAIRFLEYAPQRKRALLAFQAAGLVVGVYLLYFLIARPVVAEIDGLHIVRHIIYESPHFFLAPVIVLYLAATCVSCFVSSHPFVRLFGVLALLSFMGTYLYYTRALVSVWCFFAAVLSLIIYLHLRFRQLGGFPRQVTHHASADAPA